MKSIKKILVTLLVIGLAIIGLFIVILRWASNPYGLESSRLGPEKINIEKENELREGVSNLFLIPEYANSKYYIHLSVPNMYLGQTTSKNIQQYGFLTKVAYPKMLSLHHPNNAEYTKALGWHKGLVQLHVHANGPDIDTLNERIMIRLGKDMKNDNPLVVYEKLPSEFSIEEHFQFRYPMIEEKAKGSPSSTNEYFVVRDGENKIRYIFKCHPYTPSPGCSVEFDSSLIKEVHIKASFGRHLMNEWQTLVDEIDSLVTSWQPKLLPH